MAGNNKINAFLDEVRAHHGNTHLRSVFHELYNQDENLTISRLNEERLQFATFYVLRPEIFKLGLGPYLSERNRIALKVMHALLSHRKSDSYHDRPEYLPVLRWMFRTGYSETDLGNEYDQVLDFAAIILVREHHDKSCLNELEALIFQRNRKGLYTYDAEWAFFGSSDPECVVMVAKRLYSQDQKDVELARRLLAFTSCLNLSGDPAEQYRCLMQWLANNKPYIRYTGETNQQGICPQLFEVALENKYLQKPLGSVQMSENETSCLSEFRKLDNDTKTLLSNFSQQLHTKAGTQWSQWIASALPEQVKVAMRKRVDRHA